MAFAGSLALHDGALPQSDRIWLERRFGNDTGGDAGLALSAGPLAAADPVQTGLARSGRGLLAFVGYLAHGADLASALGAPRAAQTGLGPADLDAALALAAFERWGLDAASRLEGGFALVWWQPHQRQMVLMTDIMGQRPIYACLERGILRFATSLPLLLGWPGVPLDIDAAHMAVRHGAEQQLDEQHAVGAVIFRVLRLSHHLGDEIGSLIVLADQLMRSGRAIRDFRHDYALLKFSAPFIRAVRILS